MTFAPPDARTESSFKVLRGLGDTIFREKVDIRDIHDGTTGLPDSVTVGTPLRTLAGHDTENYIINDPTLGGAGTLVGHVVGVYEAGMTNKPAPDRFAGFAFADYDQTSNYAGSPSSNFQNAVTSLRGEYVVKVDRSYFIEVGAKLFWINSAGPGVNLAYNPDLAVGADVVVVNYISAAGAEGVPMLVTLYSDWDARYTTPTPAEIAVDKAVIGKIIALDTDTVTIRVSC